MFLKDCVTLVQVKHLQNDSVHYFVQIRQKTWNKVFFIIAFLIFILQLSKLSHGVYKKTVQQCSGIQRNKTLSRSSNFWTLT